MNHLPYSDWLFEEAQALSLPQSQELQAHLENCAECRALADSFHSLESIFRQTEMVAPVAGFSSRWQDRLQATRQHTHHKQVITTLLGVVAGLMALSAGMLFLIWPWLRSPSMLYWTWIYELFTLYSYVNSFQDLVAPLVRFSFGSIPWIVWVFSLGLLSELAVLWVISYRLLTNPRRVSQ